MTEVVVYQPPRKGYRCRKCGAKISHTNQTGLCQSCSAKVVGAHNLKEYNRKRRR